jgi:hypothetical protein
MICSNMFVNPNELFIIYVRSSGYENKLEIKTEDLELARFENIRVRVFYSHTHIHT